MTVWSGKLRRREFLIRSGAAGVSSLAVFRGGSAVAASSVSSGLDKASTTTLIGTVAAAAGVKVALATWARIQDIAKTEFLLRNCDAIRKGRTADSAPVDDVPLQDPSGAFKLLSILVAPPAPASKEAP